MTAVPASDFGAPFATCPAGKIAISGGIVSTTGAINLVESFAFEDAGTFGWQFVVFNVNPGVAENVQVEATCISLPEASLAATAATTGPRITQASLEARTDR